MGHLNVFQKYKFMMEGPSMGKYNKDLYRSVYNNYVRHNWPDSSK